VCNAADNDNSPFRRRHHLRYQSIDQQKVTEMIGDKLFFQATHALALRLVGPPPRPAGRSEPERRQVVILGGGFAGVSCALELERLLGPDRSVQVTLVSETNALLFTPMLAEVAGSSLEGTHISTPLRTTLRRTAVVRGNVASLDLEGRAVVVAGAGGAGATTLRYDQLVLALGAVTNYFGSAALASNAIGFKSLRDALRIRNRVIDVFERAEREGDPARRRALLTFVVAGGGFAGVELAGALNDFARGMLADFPGLSADELSVVLVHAGDRILPELSPSLAAYALERLRERGVSFRLGARARDARPGAVVLEPAETIETETLVWTAGARPNPLLEALPVPRDRRGAVVVGPTLALPGHPGVWAAGDCAAVADARTGRPCPPTAQLALRAGRRLGRNVFASLHGKAARPFRFASLGALCVIGHQTACAELAIPLARGRHVRFSGLLAWMLWRAIYLSKLPGLDRKVRVLSDWVIELFFPRDIAQTGETGDPPVPATR
jgi:NADH dehydrogenase